MKILIVKGSPHKNGSSNLIADYFMKGAKENGNTISVFDVAHSHIHPCLGCDFCGMNGPCCQKDDMDQLKDLIFENDMIVFVTPLYYFGMSAQLKIAIDRFYSFNGALTNKHIKSILISAAWNSAKDTMDDLLQHYQTLCRYLHFDNWGTISGLGCGTPDMTLQTIYPQQAYELGKKIK